MMKVTLTASYSIHRYLKIARQILPQILMMLDDETYALQLPLESDNICITTLRDVGGVDPKGRGIFVAISKTSLFFHLSF